MTDDGITVGPLPGCFEPSAPTTRRQAATFPYCAQGSPAAGTGPFIDVDVGNFFGEAGTWMTTRGITHGVAPTTLAPGRPVTRAELATFLYHFAGEPPVEVDVGGNCLQAGEQHQLMAAEALSFQLLNKLHTGLGLNPLVRGQAMDAFAQTWSVTLDSLGSLKHSGGPYAENLGWLSNGSVSAEAARVMNDLRLNSELHYNTMIRHSYGEVGIGFRQSADGWHAPHVFR